MPVGVYGFESRINVRCYCRKISKRKRIMITFIILNIVLPMAIDIISAWIYDSIKEKMRYQNAVSPTQEAASERLLPF